jgi:prepilin-type N-terminal cleavage/methylation domain-containing protein
MKSIIKRRGGFTLVEVLVVIVLGTVVAAALWNVLRYQQRFYRTERTAVLQHDALRLAAAVLTADLIEASGTGGDFVAIEPDSVSLRSPVGFGIVCAVDSASDRLGLFDISGRHTAEIGDSLLIYHPDGWLLRKLDEATFSSEESLKCPYAGGPTTEVAVRVEGGSLEGVPVGAPVRAFHRYTYRLERDGTGWWLARAEGDSAEILAGPFSGDGSGLQFTYLDAAGEVTDDPSRIARLDLMLVAEDRPSGRRDSLRASIRPRNQ